MAEVRISVIADDGSTKVFRLIEEAGVSAFKKIENAAVGTSKECKAVETAGVSALNKIENAAAQGPGVFDRLQACWQAITVSAYAAYHAFQKVFEYIKQGAEALQSEASFKAVTESLGLDTEKMLARLHAVSAGLIDESAVQQRAAKALLQGLSENQIISLLEGSRVAARIAGTDVVAAFDGITNAVANQTSRALKLYGIVIDQNKAFEEYAGRVGKSKEELTELEQSAALAAKTIEELRRQMKLMGDTGSEDNAAERIQRAHVGYNELGEQFGIMLNKVIDTGHQGVSEFFSFYARQAKMAAAIYKAYDKPGSNALGIPLADTRDEISKAYDEIYNGIKEKSEEIAKKIEESTITFMNEMPTAMKKALKESDEAMSAFEDRIQTLGAGADETTKSIMDLWAQTRKLFQEIEDKKDLSVGMKLEANDRVWKAYDAGVEAIRKEALRKEKDAFEEMMMDELAARKEGIAKDLAEVDKWLYSVAMKFRENPAMQAWALQESVRKKLLIVMEDEKKQYEDLTKSAEDYRASLVNTYNDAITKANEYYALSKSIGETIATETARLNGLTAKPLLPKDQMEQSARALKEMVASAADPQALQAAATGIGQWLEKFKGMSTTLGGWSIFEGMKDQQKDVLQRLSLMQSAAESSGNAWQKAANEQVAAIQSVDEWIKHLQGSIAALDQDIAQARVIDINTAPGIAAIDALIGRYQALQGMMLATGSGQGNNAGNLYSQLIQNPNSQYMADVATEAWYPEVPEYAKGTDYVPRTGLALVHQGERITPADQNRSGGSNSGPVTININGYNKDAKELAREIQKLVSNGRV